MSKRIVLAAAQLVLLLSIPAAAEEPQPRTLLVSLDAVPFWVVADVMDPALGDKALFRDFKGPVPVISTFPSSPVPITPTRSGLTRVRS